MANLKAFDDRAEGGVTPRSGYLLRACPSSGSLSSFARHGVWALGLSTMIASHASAQGRMALSISIKDSTAGFVSDSIEGFTISAGSDGWHLSVWGPARTCIVRSADVSVLFQLHATILSLRQYGARVTIACTNARVVPIGPGRTAALVTLDDKGAGAASFTIRFDERGKG